jgi:peptide chain release factor 1
MIDPNDLKVEVIYPPKGGQHVGYTTSPVRVTHIPTGLVAQVTSRSQHRARSVAIRMIEEALTDPSFIM